MIEEFKTMMRIRRWKQKIKTLKKARSIVFQEKWDSLDGSPYKEKFGNCANSLTDCILVMDDALRGPN